MTHEADQADRPDVDLMIRLATLQGLRAIPGQTSEQIAELDAQIAEVERMRDGEPADDLTLNDLFVQVHALEAMVLAQGCAIDAVTQAIASVLGEGHADAFRNTADVVESWPTTYPGDPERVIAFRAHGHSIATGMLRDMAEAIDAGMAAKAAMVPGSGAVQ